MRNPKIWLMLWAVSFAAEKPPTDQRVTVERQAGSTNADSQSGGSSRSVSYVFRLGAAEQTATALVMAPEGETPKVIMVAMDRAGHVIADVRREVAQSRAVEFGPAEAKWAQADVVIVKASGPVMLSLIGTPGAPAMPLPSLNGVSRYEITSSSRLAEVASAAEPLSLRRLSANGPIALSRDAKPSARDNGIYVNWRDK
jgi:hypothetical protein